MGCRKRGLSGYGVAGEWRHQAPELAHLQEVHTGPNMGACGTVLRQASLAYPMGLRHFPKLLIIECVVYIYILRLYPSFL